MTATDENRPVEALAQAALLLRALRRCDAGEVAVAADAAGLDLLRVLAAGIGVTVVPAAGASAHGVVLHADPREGTLGAAICAAAHLGRVVTTGPFPGDAAVIADYYREIIVKEMSVIGSGEPHVADVEDARALMAADSTGGDAAGGGHA